jgi:2-polyprenyl-6-methoxyphenol hydroxylase-like FAD-dependent oxidoreductase
MKIVVVGAGIMGLCSSMLLAADGHDVVVLERDADPPPDPSLAWEDWDRRGVNQFRLAHFFLARFRTIVEAELPQLAKDLTAAGALRYNVPGNIPDEMKGGARPGDGAYDTLTGRRTVVEAVAARMCESMPAATVYRGAAVAGLLTGPAARDGVPHVTGVRLEDGQEIGADVVVDAAGRRSALPKWLTAIGARPVGEVLDDCGFIYYGRHFRSEDGSLPVMIGPPKQDYGTIGALTLAADNGTWSVTLTTSSRDTAMRALLDADKWAAVVRQLPLAAHWLDGIPIDDRVQIMAKIEDRIRDFAPGGQPVATGVLAVADSWSCTNPSLGRGASVGLVHAVALRDLLRRSNDDPWQLALDWADTTRETVAPWFDTTIHYDRHRLNEINSLIDGQPYRTDDREWRLLRGLEGAGLLDGDLLRANLDINMVLRPPDEVFADSTVMDKLLPHLDAIEEAPALGPTRSELLATISS